MQMQKEVIKLNSVIRLSLINNVIAQKISMWIISVEPILFHNPKEFRDWVAIPFSLLSKSDHMSSGGFLFLK